MVAPVKPRKVRAHGKDSWWLVPTVATPGAPSITEINAVTGINISCTVLAEGDSLTAETGKVTLPAYLCETEQFEGNDTTTFSMGDVVGGFDPQAAAVSNDKKAFEFLRNGYTGFAVRRQGVTADQTAPEATVGQFFDVVPVEIARAIPGRSGNDSSAIYTFSAAVSVTGSPSLNVAAVA
jgi:hypothetical protein